MTSPRIRCSSRARKSSKMRCDDSLILKRKETEKSFLSLFARDTKINECETNQKEFWSLQSSSCYHLFSHLSWYILVCSNSTSLSFGASSSSTETSKRKKEWMNEASRNQDSIPILHLCRLFSQTEKRSMQILGDPHSCERTELVVLVLLFRSQGRCVKSLWEAQQKDQRRMKDTEKC
jgi:hypothetical protein